MSERPAAPPDNSSVAPAGALQGDRSRRLLPAAQGQWRVAAAPAMIAGFVDAYGLITYGTYLSFMSGNTTQTGYEGNFKAALLTALAIVFFLGGSFSGQLIAHSTEHHRRRVVLGIVAALLALIIGSAEFGLLSAAVHVAAISFAMAMMNTVMSRIGALSVNLTFVTGTLSRLGLHLALALRRAPVPDSEGPWDTHVHRALLLAGIWGAFLAGALLSGAATPRLGVWVLLLPALILSALATLDRTLAESF